MFYQPTGRHAFDVLDPGARSSEIIARSVEFLKSRLCRGDEALVRA
jgi:hypothetical protein